MTFQVFEFVHLGKLLSEEFFLQMSVDLHIGIARSIFQLIIFVGIRPHFSFELIVVVWDAQSFRGHSIKLTLSHLPHGIQHFNFLLVLLVEAGAWVAQIISNVLSLTFRPKILINLVLVYLRTDFNLLSIVRRLLLQILLIYHLPNLAQAWRFYLQPFKVVMGGGFLVFKFEFWLSLDHVAALRVIILVGRKVKYRLQNVVETPCLRIAAESTDWTLSPTFYLASKFLHVLLLVVFWDLWILAEVCVLTHLVR